MRTRTWRRRRMRRKICGWREGPLTKVGGKQKATTKIRSVRVKPLVEKPSSTNEEISNQ